jgi:hypothetical protein
MTLRPTLFLIPVALLVVLTPLAFASPPDPSWIRGIYDDADFDDVIVFLTSGGGVVEPSSSDVVPWQVAVADVFQAAEEPRSAPALYSKPPRAPPAL